MTYAKQYTTFVNDKRSFFSKKNRTLDDVAFEANTKDYAYLSKNKTIIENEFRQLFATLKKQGQHRKEFWLYCYYCCQMMETYYADYGNSTKSEEYLLLKSEIEQHIDPAQSPKQGNKKKSFAQAIGNKIAEDWKDLSTIHQHVSKMRSTVGFLNVCRIYWTFCRLTLINSFRLAQDMKLIEQLNMFSGKKIDVDNIIRTMEVPNEIFRALSVGFFVARFIMNAGLVLKHTFAPSEQEQSLSMGQRFTNELVKRHPDFLNDVVWATVNGLTNYAAVFHISAPVAGWLTAGFLVFDISLILWRRHLAEQEYLTKKSQYLTELKYYQDQLANNQLEPDQRIAYEAHCAILHGQLTELEITWKTKDATFQFNACAALLLAAGFTASMVFTPAFAVVAAYGVCMLGVAMYLSDAAYSEYKDKQLRLEQATLENRDTSAELAAYQTARHDFILTMIRNAIMPGLVIATFAVCWQAALVLTAAYLAYSLWNAYNKHQKTNTLVSIVEPDDAEVLNEEQALVYC